LLFAGVAGACLAITALVEFTSRPAPIEEFGRVGEEFFPDFVDPTLATALEVYAFDTEEVRPQEFVVKRGGNGRWSIPSHHDYPADAEDQLAKTASSVIGIERGAMVTRWKADHASYGVVNPKQDSIKVDEVEGVGKRLILRGEGDAVLADYLIGKQPDADKSDEYYVRHPDEDEVYIASLKIDLSTKFADWIDTDLLHVNQSDILQLTINDYSIDEIQGKVSQTETSVLKRDKPADDWVLEGLHEETEEVDKDAMRDAVNAIADMKIVGVREKEEGLTPELTLDRSAIASPNDFNQMRADLATKGFHLQRGDKPESFTLLATEGELFASAGDGLTYRMYFGRAFSGSQEELEIGLQSDDSTEPESNGDSKKDEEAGGGPEDDATADDESSDDSKGDEEESTDDNKSENSQPGRYVFVRIEFDEAKLDETPVMPVAPEMPEELNEKAPEKDAAEEKAAVDPGETAVEGEGDPESEESSGEEGDVDAEEADDDPLAAIREAWETAQKEHEVNLASYEVDLKAFAKKIEEGTKKAEDLNRRFADWYYVVPGETFDKLRLSRSDIVKEKEKEESADTDADSPKTDSTGDTSDAGTSPEPGAPAVGETSATPDSDESPDPEPDSPEPTDDAAPKEPDPEAAATEESTPDESAAEDNAADKSPDTPEEAPADTEPAEESE
jgi:hypothetical protein